MGGLADPVRGVKGWSDLESRDLDVGEQMSDNRRKFSRVQFWMFSLSLCLSDSIANFVLGLIWYCGVSSHKGPPLVPTSSRKGTRD